MKPLLLFSIQCSPDCKFSDDDDDDIAKVLHIATENPASGFRNRGTPPVLRLVEIMGIEQARQWGLCTMNEFRAFLGLRRTSSSFQSCTNVTCIIGIQRFEEWNPDLEIAGGARHRYGRCNNLELYVSRQRFINISTFSLLDSDTRLGFKPSPPCH